MTAQIDERLMLEGKVTSMAFSPPLPEDHPRIVEFDPFKADREEAVLWLREDEYSPLARLIEEGEVEAQFMPPRAEDDRELVPIMLVERAKQMGVRKAIREAEAILPGVPVDEGEDPRWQAILEVGDHVETGPEEVWGFISRWGGHPQEDLRNAIACCLLEHLLEYHFEAYFPRVEAKAGADQLFGDMFERCWPFGQSKGPANAERFETLRRQLGDRANG